MRTCPPLLYFPRSIFFLGERRERGSLARVINAKFLIYIAVYNFRVRARDVARLSRHLNGTFVFVSARVSEVVFFFVEEEGERERGVASLLHGEV